MTLGQRALEELKKLRLAEGTSSDFIKPGPAGSYLYEANSGDVALTIDVHSYDKYSFLVRSIAMRTSRDLDNKTSTTEYLQEQADWLTKRLVYLLEGLRLVELDELHAWAQLRSEIPYDDEAALHYYEILLQGGTSLKFSRYCKERSRASRATDPCHFDDQTLSRVIDDLAKTLASNLREC